MAGFFKAIRSKLESPQAPKEKTVDEGVSQVDTAGMDDEQLVAVIAAAVMSCLGGNSNIVVRSIRRVNDLTPIWGKISRAEQMANRF